MIKLTERLQVNIAAATQEEVFQWTREIATFLSHIGGGCTVIDANGFYIRDDNGLLDQDLVKAILYDCCDAEEAYEAVLPLLAEYGVAAEQEAVYVRVNSQTRIIYTTELVALVQVGE